MSTFCKSLINVFLPYCKPLQVSVGSSLMEISEKVKSFHTTPILAAKVNNHLKGLDFKITLDCKVTFIDLLHPEGIPVYIRSLYFVLTKAVTDVFPGKSLLISHSISKGTFCTIKNSDSPSLLDIEKIKNRMAEIIQAKIPFIKKSIPFDKTQISFNNDQICDLSTSENINLYNATIYECDGTQDYFYGCMVPNTGYLTLFDLIHYPPGLILLFPNFPNPLKLPEFREQKKLFSIFSEFKNWGNILGINNISRLNYFIKSGTIEDFVHISEALHEKKIAQIADMITNSPDQKLLVLIAGPSSSGKTTFAQRLAIQLKVNGIKPVTISMDNYFLGKNATPLDEHGQPDFESINALDLQLFNDNLLNLISGYEVELPIFNFSMQQREPIGKKLQLQKDNILLIEGIHALNPLLSTLIPNEKKFKIYVSALASMNIDDHNRIPTTDTRLIRRIVRDAACRAKSAQDTIKMWNSVRLGEEKNIFPFQEEADIMFNSYLMFELGVLKLLAEPLLKTVSDSVEEYSEATRLIKFLNLFLPISDDIIPYNSILREFIGNSCFYKNIS